jgi:hypothetical protein
MITELLTRGPALSYTQHSGGGTMIGILIMIGVLYLAFHHHHYRRNRRRGLSVLVSMRGPFGTRISRRF